MSPRLRRRLVTGSAALLLAAAVLAAARAQPRFQRYGSIIGLKAEKVEAYKKLHASVWPEVLAMIKACHIRNYSIYLKEVEPGRFFLFSYFEYTGGDFAADMAKMAADPVTQKWWKETDPCQTPIPLRQGKEWWSAMAEVFHAD
jgi:L-rhamnose mutarotase